MELLKMSKLNRKQLKRLLLKEFKMMGMAPIGSFGDMPLGMGRGHSSDHFEPMHHGGGHKGAVSKEDCCKAVLCLIECCDCPDTKEMLRQCCEDILASC